MASDKPDAGSDAAPVPGGVAPNLDTYVDKRQGDGTPEPMGGSDDARKHLFVVHQHAASRMHWDLRLEWEGVLLSWAVPRCLSLDPSVKRLAVQTEPHPLEYADFEGVIPKGNYGAGEMILWDRGVWEPIPEEKYTWDQKILFELKGYKLRGRWALIKTGKGTKDWLLIKKADGYARPEAEEDFDPASILSGLTIRDLQSGQNRADALRADLEAAGVPRGTLSVDEVSPQNARRHEAGPFADPNWIFEIKYDGFRVLAQKSDGPEGESGRVRLRYRSGHIATETWPEVAQALSLQPFRSCVLDGEVVVLDEAGKPSFQMLQKRAQLKRNHEIQRAMVQLPATLFVFDVLAFEDFDLRGAPVEQRKQWLQRLIPKTGPLRYAEHFPGEAGEVLFEQIRTMGLEGLVAKRLGSTYDGTRSDDWLKIKAEHSEEFAVIGYTKPESALHLLSLEDPPQYCGRVGSGLGPAQWTEVMQWLEGAERDAPIVDLNPRGDGRWGRGKPVEHVWVEPRLVVEVKFTEKTRDGNLRHPVFQRVRLDRSAALTTTAEPEAVTREVKYTNRDKVFWPDEQYTKGDLIDYYLAVAPWLVPLLDDRPIVMTRFPDGIHGKSFFQKDAPGFLPDWVRRERMWSDDTRRHIDYLICDCTETLGYIANMGSIPIHVWSSRTTDLPHPDWCIIDLDPKDAPFADVVRIALAVKALCDDLGLPAYPKTSGATGIHVLIPLGRQITYQQCRDLGMLIARAVCMELGDIGTTERSLRARKGRVYLDTLQNGTGRLIVSPYCVRPRPCAPVSTPLHWDEVGPDLDPAQHTIKTVPARLEAQGDLLRPILDDVPDLLAALGRLSEIIAVG